VARLNENALLTAERCSCHFPSAHFKKEAAFGFVFKYYARTFIEIVFFCVSAIENHKSNLRTNANCLSILHKNLQLETALRVQGGGNLGLRILGSYVH